MLRCAAVLCEGLTRLEVDEQVWGGLFALDEVPAHERQRVLAIVGDVDVLLTFESRVMNDEHPLFDSQRAAALSGMRQ